MVQGVVPGVDRPALPALFPTLQGNSRRGGGCRRECRLLAAHAGAVRRHGRDLFAHHPATSKARASACSRSARKSTKATSSPAPPTPLLKMPGPEFHRQRRGPRYLRRQGRRHRLRRLHRQRGAQGQRRPGRHGEADAAGIARGHHYAQDRLRAFARAAFTDFKKRVDYSEYGGAPLLGVRGVCIICHGRSNANAIKNAIRVAAEFASASIMNQRIEDELQGDAGRSSGARVTICAIYGRPARQPPVAHESTSGLLCVRSRFAQDRRTVAGRSTGGRRSPGASPARSARRSRLAHVLASLRRGPTSPRLSNSDSRRRSTEFTRLRSPPPSARSTRTSTRNSRPTKARRSSSSACKLKKDAAAGPVEITLKPRYQTCNDTHCVPPVTKTVTATLNVDAAAAAADCADSRRLYRGRRRRAVKPPPAPPAAR